MRHVPRVAPTAPFSTSTRFERIGALSTSSKAGPHPSACAKVIGSWGCASILVRRISSISLRCSRGTPQVGMPLCACLSLSSAGIFADCCMMAEVAAALDSLLDSVCGDGTLSGGAVPSSAFGAGEHDDDSDRATKGAEAALEPHLHIVELDELLDGRFVLTNFVSNEKVLLPEGVRWKLLFDDDGFGVCEPADESSGAEPKWLEDIFDFEVYRSATVGYVIRGRSGPMEGQLVSLSRFMAKFTEAEATIVLGVSKSKKTFSIVFLRWVRAPACRLLWSAKSVYEQLGFSMFNQQPWRWAASMASLPRWQKDMTELGYAGHVLRSAGMKVARVSKCSAMCSLSHMCVCVCVPRGV